MPKYPTGMRKHGRGFVYRAVEGDQRITRQLGQDEAEARRLARLYRTEVLERRRKKVKPSGLETVEQLVKDWLRVYVPLHRRKRDHKMVQARLENHVLPIIGNVRLQDVRKRHLTDLAVSLASKGLAVNTQRHILSDMRCAFNWGLDEERMESSPFRGRKILPAPPRHAPNPLTDAELKAILDNAREPYRCAIILALRTGLRWGEQCALTWRHCDLDSEEPSLTIERSKGGRPRRIPIDAETVAILKRWRKETKGVYVQPWRPRQAQWAALSSKASRVKWHWHQLRHTFATQYLRDGGSIEALSKLLGHSEVRTTEIYGAIEERLIRADFARVQRGKLGQNWAKATA